MKWRNEYPGRFYDANESTVVYFDSHSGDTHLLSDFAAHVMQQFGDRTLTTDQLIDHILPTFEPEDASQLKEALPGVLDELVCLDILKRE